MDNTDDRYLELLAEMVMKQDTMVDELKTLNKKADTTNERLDTVNVRLEKLEQQQIKTNLSLGELRLSVNNLGEREHIVVDHEERIRKIEEKVFH